MSYTYPKCLVCGERTKTRCIWCRRPVHRPDCSLKHYEQGCTKRPMVYVEGALMSKMILDEKINALRAKAEELDLACIVYAFDENGSGFDYKADMGDALVAIKRIVKRFKINAAALTLALKE